MNKLRRMTRIKQKPAKKTNSWKPVEDRQYRIIKEYSRLNFNYQSVFRFKQKDLEHNHITKVYNQKISQTYVDKMMDNLVDRRSIDLAVAFVEQDDYHNNHLHFAWNSTVPLSRKQIANSMRTSISYVRDIRPILGVEDAIAYFSKRIEAKGSYHNIYYNNN